MSPYYQSSFTVIDALRLMGRYRRRWLLPALIIGGLSCVYATVKRDRWEAAQAVTLRNEAVGNSTPGSATAPGEFQLEDEMKVAQETLLEIARSRPVLAAALADVGPPENGRSSSPWPSEKDVDDLRDALKLTPPKGAEFGKTEIFYLKLRDKDRNRAVRLVDRLCDEVENSFGQLRDARASGMAAELAEIVSLSTAEFDRAKQRLADMERSIGSNLVELRMLEQSPAGVSELNRELTEAENEVRQARTRQSVNRSIQQWLRDAQQDPQSLVTAPNTLFEAQPNLKRLADGLVDVQLKTSSLLGVMADRHPQVVASRQAEEMVRQKIFSELSLALRAIEAENQLTDGRVAYLEDQLADKRRRMSEVAALRVEYSSAASDVAHRRGLLETAERQLADVRATQAVARTCSLIHRLGTPDTGSHPVGPGRVTIALIGIGGGLIAGLAIVILTMPVSLGGQAVQTAMNGNGYSDEEHDLIAGNGHAHASDLGRNRFAGVT